MTELIEEINAASKSLVVKDEDFFFLHHQEKLFNEFRKINNSIGVSDWFKKEKEICSAIEEGKFKSYMVSFWSEESIINCTVGQKVMVFIDYLLSDRKQDLFHVVSYDEIKNEREIILKLIKDNRSDLMLCLKELISYAIDENVVLDEDSRYSYDHLLLFMNYVTTVK